MPNGRHCVSVIGSIINYPAQGHFGTSAVFVSSYRGFLKWSYPTNPWVLPLKMIILGWRLGVPPFKETPISGINGEMYCKGNLFHCFLYKLKKSFITPRRAIAMRLLIPHLFLVANLVLKSFPTINSSKCRV